VIDTAVPVPWGHEEEFSMSVRSADADLTSVDFLSNPYPTYQRLREEDPAH
jgi:hypothetical protein